MDSFSCLPDDLLIHILSFLSNREAATTSILSTRWRHLWKLTGRLFLPISSRDVYQRVQSIDSILSSFENPNFYPLHEFTLTIGCPLTISTGITLERWISFAINRLNVQHFSINVILRHRQVPLIRSISFPPASSCKRMNNLMHLKLSRCKIPSFECFRNLRTISLNWCCITEAAIESINLNCALLERLILSNIFNKLETLKVSSSLRRLKHLSINHCRIHQAVVIESPNLASLTFRGHFFDPNLAYHLRAPRLEQFTLSFGTVWVMSYFLSFIRDSGVEKVDLSLDMWRLKELDHSCHSLLKNVTMLRLAGGSFFNLDPLLRASLSLKNLKLSIFHSNTTNIDSSLLSLGSSSSDGNGKHHNLEKIHIWGFRRMPSHLQMLEYMVELAVGLKEMVIIWESSFHDNNKLDDRSIGEYIKEVTNKLPQGAELVIRHAAWSEGYW